MESNYKGDIKLWDIAPMGLPCALLAVKGKQAPDSHGKLWKFIKLSGFKTLCRSQHPIHLLTKGCKTRNILLCGPN